MIGGTANGSFSVNLIPSGSTLSWTYNSDLLTLVSSSAKGIIVKPKTSTTTGDATITAKFTNSNGSVQTINHYVGVNGPHYRNVQLVVKKSSDGSEAYPSGGLCPNTYYYAYLDAGTTLTNVNWGASSQLQVITASNSQLYFKTLSQGYGTLSITATTTYGVTKSILGVTLIGGGTGCGSSSYYSVSAVPSSNIVDIEFDMDEFNSQINEKVYAKAPTFDIRLYSILGVMVKQARSSGENVQLDVSALPNGSYVVHVYDGISDTPQTKMIQIQR